MTKSGPRTQSQSCVRAANSHEIQIEVHNIACGCHLLQEA